MKNVLINFRTFILVSVVLFLTGCSLNSSGTSALPADVPQGSYLLTMRAPEMFCGGCTGSVKAAVGATPGVIFVDADNATKEVAIIYDPSVVTSDEIMKNSVFDTYGRELISDVPL